MLAPDARAVAVELLRPPPGYTLDRAVLTTYSLDLDALLALPLGVLARAEGGIEELIRDPLNVHVALREAADRIHLFVDAGGIAIPKTARTLFAMLEASVHPVRAPNGGAFHPKVWVARFVDDAGAPLLRVAVLSRNLTFDRSWDLAFASEGEPGGRNVAASRDLADLVRRLPDLVEHTLADSLIGRVAALADEIQATSFAAPDGFESPARFVALGLTDGARKPWRPRADGTRLLAIAPFANATALEALVEISGDDRTLVSRPETLDALPDEVLARWSQVLTLSDVAADEPEDGTCERPSGLHAKAIAVEHGWDVSWFVGSANLTAAAFTGTNVEMMVALTAKRSQHGIEKFKDAGFLNLCTPWQRRGPPPTDAAEAARARLEQARRAVLDAELTVRCATDGERWTWRVDGVLPPLPDVEVQIWPVSVSGEHARPFGPEARWQLPVARLTAFVGVRLASPEAPDDVRFTLKLPAEGLPDGRLAEVLRSLIDSPERFLQFLRALLGGLDNLVDATLGDGNAIERGSWGVGLGGQRLLEDLVRVASREPARLEPVRRLIADLRQTEQGRTIVPDDLFALWQVVESAIAPETTR